MADDLKALFADFQEDFVGRAKAHFKDKWSSLSDEVKKAIQFTAREGAKVAAEVAAGGNPDTDPVLKGKIAILRSNAKDIEVMAKLEFKSFLEQALSDAARFGGTAFRYFIKGVVGF